MLQIHEKIKQERLSANLTEDEMADKLRISRSTYQYWEKKTPSIDKIKQVAKALGKPDDYFFVTIDEDTEGQKPTDPLPMGDKVITLGDYIKQLEDNNTFLRTMLKDKTDQIKTNLDKALEYMANMHVQGSAARTVVLRSLSRLEKKPEESLIYEVDKVIVEGFYEQQKQDSEAGKRK